MYARAGVGDYYRQIQSNIRSEVLGESVDYLLSIETKIDEIVDYYFSKYSLQKIEEIENGVEVEIKDYTKTIYAHERERHYQYEWDIDRSCQKIIVTVLINNNPNIKMLSELWTSTCSMSFSSSEYARYNDKIVFEIETKWYCLDLTNEEIKQKTQRQLENLHSLVWWINNDIEKENVILKNYILQTIQNRVNEIKKNTEKVKSLTEIIWIPIKKKEVSGVDRIVNIKKNDFIKKIEKPSWTHKYTYKLDENIFKQIVNFIEGQCRQFENTPNVYHKLWEEDLRNIILSALNGIFEWKATGETFSSKGKTDIYLLIDEGNILKGECKIWKWGEMLILTIDQIISYLTRRDNFGFTINFCMNKDFSKLLDQAFIKLWTHPTIVGVPKKINESHFQTIHNKTWDEVQEITVDHMFFNLYVTEK